MCTDENYIYYMKQVLPRDFMHLIQSPPFIVSLKMKSKHIRIELINKSCHRLLF